MNPALARMIIRHIESDRRARSRVPAPSPKPGTRVTGAVASGNVLVIATVQFQSGRWHYRPSASVDFVLSDENPRAARYLQTRIIEFCRENGIAEVSARRPSANQGMPAHAAAHKLMTLLELARSVTVEMVHPNTIAAWRTREEPLLPRLEALRHGVELATRHAFDLYDRAIETAVCAGMLAGGRHG